jgi:hypothetical protein
MVIDEDYDVEEFEEPALGEVVEEDSGSDFAKKKKPKGAKKTYKTPRKSKAASNARKPPLSSTKKTPTSRAAAPVRRSTRLMK